MFLNWIVLKGQAEAGYWHNGSVAFVHHMCIEARSLGVMICIVSQDHSRNGAGCSFFAAKQVVTSELQQLPDEFCIAVCCIHWSPLEQHLHAFRKPAAVDRVFHCHWQCHHHTVDI